MLSIANENIKFSVAMRGVVMLDTIMLSVVATKKTISF
jgi:hypothetical protein